MPIIEIKPAALFALVKIIPFLAATLGFLWLSWHCWPVLIWLAVASAFFAVYRYLYIRHISYTITDEYQQVSRGLFFRHVDTIELFRVKDYVLTQSVILQILRLMDL